MKNIDNTVNQLLFATLFCDLLPINCFEATNVQDQASFRPVKSIRP